MAKWQLQEAKNKLSELIDKVESDGPQIITRHGVEVVAVVSYLEFKKPARKKRKLGDFLLNSPLRGSDISVERDPRSLMRRIELGS